METLDQNAINQVIDYFATELNPAQMESVLSLLILAVAYPIILITLKIKRML